MKPAGLQFTSCLNDFSIAQGNLQRSYISDLKSDLAFPSLSDLKDLAMLRDFLKPFQEVTTVMSSERNVTASSVIIFVN